MSNPEHLPEIPPRFMDHLRDQFPIKLPAPSTTTREDLYHAGEQAVLDWIEWVIQCQQESERLN